MVGFGFGRSQRRRALECCRRDGQAQCLAEGELIGVRQIVDLQQVVECDAVGLGDVPEGVAVLDCVLLRSGGGVGLMLVEVGPVELVLLTGALVATGDGATDSVCPAMITFGSLEGVQTDELVDGDARGDGDRGQRIAGLDLVGGGAFTRRRQRLSGQDGDHNRHGYADELEPPAAQRQEHAGAIPSRGRRPRAAAGRRVRLDTALQRSVIAPASQATLTESADASARSIGRQTLFRLGKRALQARCGGAAAHYEGLSDEFESKPAPRAYLV